MLSKRREENPPSGWVCFFGGAGQVKTMRPTKPGAVRGREPVRAEPCEDGTAEHSRTDEREAAQTERVLLSEWVEAKAHVA